MINREITFTISARGKKEHLPIGEFLETHFSTIPLRQVDSVFGFLEPSTLYSGRPFLARQLSEADTAWMYENSIGVRIPCTNHLVSGEEYRQHIPFFEKYERKGNSVICTDDKLARWIRRDFPGYQIEASILKETDTHEKIDRALDLYDTVILPMNLNQKTGFLASIAQKERITLFGNAGCALTCPDRICYWKISETNKKLAAYQPLRRYLTFMLQLGITSDWCSNRLHPRKLKGMVDFDLDHLYGLGFKRFKMLRERRQLQTGH
ncbi:MAG: hypothetical protein V2B15_11290 [Bacteroidota bacterium]